MTCETFYCQFWLPILDNFVNLNSCWLSFIIIIILIINLQIFPTGTISNQVIQQKSTVNSPALIVLCGVKFLSSFLKQIHYNSLTLHYTKFKQSLLYWGAIVHRFLTPSSQTEIVCKFEMIPIQPVSVVWYVCQYLTNNTNHILPITVQGHNT